MRQLSPEGQAAVSAIAQRTGFSTDAVTSMLFSVIAGNGSMAQFNHPEFGGSGQWMRGGMIMVSDMFNNALKAQVDNLCYELAQLVASQPGLTMTGSFQSQSQGGMASGMGMGGPMGGGQSSLFIPDTSANWWPSDLGMPASVGAQNSVRYAYFPGARRLAIDLNGHVTTYDTMDHQIGGFGQQQSGSGSFTFTSQYGLVDVASLPVVSGGMQQPAPQAMPQPAPQYAPQAAPAAPPLAQSEIMSALEKLADLHAKGILTDGEFSAKKAELLSRL